MTIHEAQELWNEQPANLGLSDEAMKTIIKESNTLDRSVFWRDLSEWIAAVFACVAFVWLGSQKEGVQSLLFFGVALVALIPGTFVAISNSKARKEEEEPALSNREHIASAIKKYRRQEKLLNSVAVWYLTPLFVMALLIGSGFLMNLPDKSWQFKAALFSIQMGGCIAIFATIAWLNFRASKKHLRPKIEELEAILRDGNEVKENR